MSANQTQWPREWLMTDERMAGRMWEAMDRLPAGAGIVFRHYATPASEREELAGRLAEQCQLRGLVLAIARDVDLAKRLQVPLVHNPTSDPGALAFSRAAHSIEEAKAACNSGASLIFLSPLSRTRSHPGAQPLSRKEAQAIVSACPAPVIALGGICRALFEEIRSDGFYGWAGIDAWLGAGQSRE